MLISKSSRISQANIYLVLFIGANLFLLSATTSNNNICTESYKSTNQDIELFATLVKYVSSTGLGFDRSEDFNRMQIDPRRVDTTYSCYGHVHSCDYLQKEDFKQLPPGKLSENRQILDQFGIPETDVLRDQECIFSGGLPEPPDPDNPDNERSSSYPPYCEEQGFFLTIIFSWPEPVAVISCSTPERNKPANSLHSCKKVIAFEYTSYSRSIYEIYLKKDPQDGWKVIRKKRLFSIYS